MAKKTAKKTKKKAAARSSKTSRAKTASKKTAKKQSTKKKVAKTPTRKKASSSKKPAAKKKPAKKTAKKPAPKKKVAKKPPTKKAPKKTSRPDATKPARKTAVKAPASADKPASQAQAAKTDQGRKGITVVNKKSPRRPRTPPPSTFMMPSSGLAGFGAALGKPLIPSGPSASDADALAEDNKDSAARKKSPFTKRELNKFRKILVTKREELSGEVSELENEALGRGAAEQRTKSQAVDDQGSEAADQALGLDLVAAERRLLSEIVVAIRRIDDGVYGICELTGKAINKERLEELPWTRYSIDAARQLERRSLGS